MLYPESAGASRLVWGHSPQRSSRHWDQHGFHLPRVFQLLLQLLVHQHLFMLLLPEAAERWMEPQRLMCAAKLVSSVLRNGSETQ